MQNISIHMLIDNMQAKDFVKFDIMKIMIHLAWVPNSMVIFSASYETLKSVPNFPFSINYSLKWLKRLSCKNVTGVRTE